MYLGIDFGTSFSQVCTMYLDHPLLLLNPGEYGIPSEFYYDRDMGILVGQDALDSGQGTAAANLVSEVKMAILSGKSFTLDGRTFTAKDIIKEIYKTLISRAVQNARKRDINTKIEGIVISVPAKFGMQERALIHQAAEECLGSTKINVKAIIKEPVAAAIAYYNTDLEDDTHILVYDLGGGTCDVALVKADSSSSEFYTVVDSDMERIGGRDWDEALIKHLIEIFENKSNIRIRGNVGFEEKIRRTAISVKHDLSDPTKERSIARVELNGRLFTAIISRNVFDEITGHLLAKTFDCLRGVYERHAVSCNIDEIVCVGGSSNMLQVEEGLRRLFPNCNIRLYNPEYAVVNGATIFAQFDHGTNLVDISSFSYGTDTNSHYGYADNKLIVSNILLKGAKLPATECRYYTPVVDNQEFVTFNIFESEYTDKEFDHSDPNKRFIGAVRLTLPPRSPKSLDLKCQIGLTEKGLLTVEASEPSGKKIKSVFNLNEL